VIAAHSQVVGTRFKGIGMGLKQKQESLRLSRSFVAMESVFIRAHPWFAAISRIFTVAI
jgi:hypothetical protein